LTWQVQEAKQRFSELIRRTLDEGPQVVTRHGEEVVVVIAADAYRKSRAADPDFAEFLLSGPRFDDLDLERSRELPREIDFGA
jgi:prevent-host-death family protein